MNEEIFTIAEQPDGKCLIKVGSQQASMKKFNNYTEAKEYIESKPWELITFIAIAAVNTTGRLIFQPLNQKTMTIVKSIGKNTLGGGKKMNVELKTYNRSTHDLSYVWRNTQAVGSLVPFMCEVGLPNDTWDIDLQHHIMTHPTIGPLFGSFKMQADIFVCPIRLYNAMLHNNALNVGLSIKQVKLPQIKTEILAQDLADGSEDFKQIEPSCLLSYLGLS